jgi:ferredoxin
MITLRINNREIQVEEGTSVMKAALISGIDVPNLCWHDDLEHFTSCMLCLMKDKSNGRLFPSCSIKATEGMEVVTDDEEIGEARQMALELLLSEHVGDCEAPCHIACPAHMNIPLMNRLIAAGNFDEALKVVREDISLPSVLGRICPAPCEGACHRKSVDEAVSICLLKRFAGDEGRVPDFIIREKSGKKVAVIGAGPAGLSAAYYLQLRGIQTAVFDKSDLPGGQLRTSVKRDILPIKVLDREIEIILNTGVEFHGGRTIDREEFDSIRKNYDAVVVATGATDQNTEKFGLKTSAKGIFADSNTYRTSEPDVFAIGNVLRPSRLAVRSVGQGKEVAFSVVQFLSGEQVKGEPRMFNSRFGRLVSEEYQEYLKESVNLARVYPGNDKAGGFSAEEAKAEAKRCMHCDCRAVDNCKLRIYSDRYSVNQRRFNTGERRRIKKLNNHSLIIYEPEKCIKCGICVRLTEKYGEKFGFTYIGRGFDVIVGTPFNEELKEALTATALKVAEGCPTGAISLIGG